MKESSCIYSIAFRLRSIEEANNIKLQKISETLQVIDVAKIMYTK